MKVAVSLNLSYFSLVGCSGEIIFLSNQSARTSAKPINAHQLYYVEGKTRL